MKSIETKYLKPGDVLFWTKDTVLTHPVNLIKTQRGKVEFAVRTKSGAVIAKCWNRNTKVLIESK